MRHFLFRLLHSTTTEECEKQLRKKRVKGIYLIEEEATGERFIGGHAAKTPQIDGVFLVEDSDAVNWERQWELFSQGFKEGKAHIDLTPFGTSKTLQLLPGPGFGDLSHPTTYLMIEMMQNEVQGLPVADIGTGSGILSLSALLMGALHAYGIDIDAQALAHARKNAALNSLENQAHFSPHLPSLSSPCVFLMNMILPEQREVNPSQWNPIAKRWITSGILKKQHKEYLALTKTWGWKALEERERGEWLGFIFQHQKDLIV